MIFNLDSTGGLIRIGPAAIVWQNPDSEFSGFTVLSWNDYSLEFGDLDEGNGIHVTGYADGYIAYSKTLLKL